MDEFFNLLLSQIQDCVTIDGTLQQTILKVVREARDAVQTGSDTITQANLVSLLLQSVQMLTEARSFLDGHNRPENPVKHRKKEKFPQWQKEFLDGIPDEVELADVQSGVWISAYDTAEKLGVELSRLTSWRTHRNDRGRPKGTCAGSCGQSRGLIYRRLVGAKSNDPPYYLTMSVEDEAATMQQVK